MAWKQILVRPSMCHFTMFRVLLLQRNSEDSYGIMLAAVMISGGKFLKNSSL